MKVRVYYEDTDCGGIVYHSQYLNFCERDRSERFFARGLMPGSDKSGFVVKKMECDFKGSAKLGDLLEVTSTLIECKGCSFWLRQAIYKENTLLFEAKVLLAYIDKGRLSRIDGQTKKYIAKLF